MSDQTCSNLGDFNTPRPDREGEPVGTWADIYPEVEAEPDTAERAIVEHPRLHDAYKQVHQAGDPWPYSHRDKNSPTPERRYDHIYVTDGFTVTSCRYLGTGLTAT
jgi:hypothetical protein